MITSRLLRCALLVAAVLLLTTAALATTFSSAQRYCPVCGEIVEVQLPMSTNDVGGQDRDLLQRAGGAQIFMEVVASCGICGFTGWPADFSEEKPRRRGKDPGEGDELAITKELRKAIVEGNALQRPEALAGVPHEPEAPFAHMPSWARLDVLAQTVALRGGEPERIADINLQAAWAVRLGYHPVHLSGLEPNEPQREWLFGRLTDYTEQAQELELFNPADIELWVAVRLLATAAQAPGDLRCIASSYGASLLRSHGEHRALLASLPLLEPCVEATAWPGKVEAIRESVELERFYQRRARDGFVEVLEAGTLEPLQATLTTYLVGELERRLGESDAARGHFDAALAMSMPEGLDVWIREQRCLLDQVDPVLGLLKCRAERGVEPAPETPGEQPAPETPGEEQAPEASGG